jgi:hypothetical protein
MASRTANSLTSCVTRLRKETEMRDVLMKRLFVEDDYSLADIQAVLKRGGYEMSRSGIRGVLVRLGVDTGRKDLAS